MERIRRGEHVNPVLGAVLTAATPVVRLGMWRRMRQPRVRIDARVISFGNLTVGGTGKTPAVVERALAEMAAGRKVAVLTRGYGSGRRRGIEVVAAGEERVGKRDWLGDEPELIARRVPGVVIVRGADRAAAARAAVAEYGCDTLILDDGYQYLRLERDENVLLIDATNPFGNGRLLPRGILREPLPAMARATHIVLTRCDQTSGLDALIEKLGGLAPNVPIRRTRHKADSLWRVHDDSAVPLDELRGREAAAVCAIGNPESFFKILEDLGAHLTQRLAFRDHADIPPGAIPSSGLVVTTEKDAVRMRKAADNVVALRISLEDMPSQE